MNYVPQTDAGSALAGLGPVEYPNSAVMDPSVSTDGMAGGGWNGDEGKYPASYRFLVDGPAAAGAGGPRPSAGQDVLHVGSGGGSDPEIDAIVARENGSGDGAPIGSFDNPVLASPVEITGRRMTDAEKAAFDEQQISVDNPLNDTAAAPQMETRPTYDLNGFVTGNETVPVVVSMNNARPMTINDVKKGLGMAADAIFGADGN